MPLPKFLVPIIVQLVQLLTPNLSIMLREFAVSFYQKAKETSNPFDDVAAGLLLGLLNIETPPE